MLNMEYAYYMRSIYSQLFIYLTISLKLGEASFSKQCESLKLIGQKIAPVYSRQLIILRALVLGDCTMFAEQVSKTRLKASLIFLTAIHKPSPKEYLGATFF